VYSMMNGMSVRFRKEVANAVGASGMKYGWIEDERFADGKGRLEELRRIWYQEMYMNRSFPLFDGAPSPYYLSSVRLGR